jgi:hypothetical protein
MWRSGESESFAATLPARASSIFEQLLEILVDASNNPYGRGFNRISADEENLVVEIAIPLRKSHYDSDCRCLAARWCILIDTVNPYPDKRLGRLERERERGQLSDLLPNQKAEMPANGVFSWTIQIQVDSGPTLRLCHLTSPGNDEHEAEEER